MEAVENDSEYELRFPYVEHYSKGNRGTNEEWHKVGDVREWEKLGHKIRVYRENSSKRALESL